MNIRFVDLPRQNKTLKRKIMPIIGKIISDADFTMGKRVEKFEEEFASYCKKKYTVSLNSGTDALLIALMAHGIGNGDEVITVPNSYFSTAMVINLVGATPVFVDINPLTHTIDTSKIEEKITKKTKAIIPVHLFGQPADMDPIIEIAKKHNIIIIEDACQAHGALYKGKKVPIGITGAFSFFPGKNLGAFGEGGALVTNDKKVAEKARYLRNDGSIKKYYHEMFGIKSRLDALQAAVLSIKLPYLDAWNVKRRKHVINYNKLLQKIPQIKIPYVASYATHSFHLYVIECEKRDLLQQYLKNKGIETIIHYPTPIHLQKAYLKFGFKKGMFPITEHKAKKILSLPIFPELQIDEIKFICDEIKKFYKK